MKQWLTIRDLRDYLQISENKIRYLMKHKQIPYHDNHGFLRFDKSEIDEWMKEPVSSKQYLIDSTVGKMHAFLYRDRPIKSFVLTANKILIGKTPWGRLPGFLRSFGERVNEIKVHDNGREFLHRKEFAIFSNNFNDYLRVCCQLGLIEKRKSGGRKKEYYPTEYARRISSAGNDEEVKKEILESVLGIVKKKWETIPDERHSVFLLWYILSLKAKGIKPTERDFTKAESELKTYFPLIRLNFAKSLCQFLFNNDREEEQQFLDEWNQLISSKKTAKKRDGGERLTLFDE